MITWKVFRILKKHWYGFKLLLFSYKLPNFKSVEEKLPKLEPRVSHRFVIKIVLRKKLLKFWHPLKLASDEIFLFQNLVVCMRYHNIFFAILRLYFWSIHMDKNIILATSFSFKLNNNLKQPPLGLWKWLIVVGHLIEVEYKINK